MLLAVNRQVAERGSHAHLPVSRSCWEELLLPNSCLGSPDQEFKMGAEQGWGKVEASTGVPWPVHGTHFVPCQLLVVFLSKCVCKLVS